MREKRQLIGTRLELLEPRYVLDSTVVFNEVFYHPSAHQSADLEWIELYNQMSIGMDISGWELADGVRYRFPEGTAIPGHGYLVVAADPQALAAATGFQGAIGPFDGRLANSGERVVLLNANGRRLSELEYGDRGEWTAGADGTGASLAKRAPSLATAAAENWTFSREVGGTPGAQNFPTRDGGAAGPDAMSVAFHEIAPAAADKFFLELINAGTQPLDLSTIALANSRTGAMHRFASEILAPGELRAVNRATLGFMPSDGDVLAIYSADGNELLDVQVVTNRLRGMSNGRWLFPAAPTPGLPNQFEFNTDIVINEIMYHTAPNIEVPLIPPTYSENVILPFDATWSYNDTGVALDGRWYEQVQAVDNESWKSGPATLGFEDSPLAIPIHTELKKPSTNSPRFTTYYFQTEFELSPEILDAAEVLQLNHLIDDGAIFYLNGRELSRFNLPDGDITASVAAVTTIDNAAVVGPLQLDKERLRPGKNLLSAEVHLRTTFSTDVVFAAQLVLGRQLTPMVPSLPASENTDEWIELYNRGTLPVDMSGWQLRDAVQFEFATGTILPPGAYAVIANDADAFARNHPGITALGSFTGTLSNRDDRIQLRDAHHNPADEVHYFDGGRWSALADGGGSSLELRDPYADNTAAEAWAGSDESKHSNWNTYTIRRRATADTGPLQWNEFVFGMLRDGTVLIDDVSVVRDPAGAARQLIQNGNFESDAIGESAGTWRIIGNHHGTIVADPSDATNQVLMLDATGPTHHEHNYASTTFVDNEPVLDGIDYEISFRAKWLRGGNQLLSRFYVNRVAATSTIEMPLHGGTPGAANSQYSANLGPTFSALSHAPVTPQEHQPVTVTISAVDPDQIRQMQLWWALPGEAFTSVTMVNRDGVFQASIPGQAAGAVVQFFIEGEDGQGAHSMFPAAGTASRALYQVADGRGAGLPIDQFRIMMLPADTRQMTMPTQAMSNEFVGATVVVNNQEVFYDVGVHAKGASRARLNPELWGSYTIRFHPDQRFRGVHEKIGLDKSGNRPRTQEEIMVDLVSNHAAGGLLSNYTDLAYSIAPIRSQDSTVILELARYDDVFLEERFDQSSDAVLFEHSLIYYPTRTQDGTPEGLKLIEPNGVIGTGPVDLGSDKEFYRWNNLIKNNRAADDYRAVIALNQVFNLPTEQMLASVDQVIDVDQWLRTFAVMLLNGVGDSYFTGKAQHNSGLLVRPSDGRVLLVPWDADAAYRQDGITLINPELNALLLRPDYKRLFYGHLHDIVSTTFNSNYLTPWAAEYGRLVAQDYSTIPTYADRQAKALTRLLDQDAPRVDFQLTTSTAIDEGVWQLTGKGWVDVRQIRLAGSDQVVPVTWTDVTTWTANVPLPADTAEVTLEAIDFQGRHFASATVAVGGLAGDFNGDRHIDDADIALLCAGIRRADRAMDLTQDDVANLLDLSYLVETLLQTTIGDANLDRRFDSADLVQVFVAGEYEDAVVGNSSWSSGDWNCDGESNSRDLVAAFVSGDYQGANAQAKAPRHVVPMSLVAAAVDAVVSRVRTVPES